MTNVTCKILHAELRKMNKDVSFFKVRTLYAENDNQQQHLHGINRNKVYQIVRHTP